MVHSQFSALHRGSKGEHKLLGFYLELVRVHLKGLNKASRFKLLSRNGLAVREKGSRAFLSVVLTVLIFFLSKAGLER